MFERASVVLPRQDRSGSFTKERSFLASALADTNRYQPLDEVIAWLRQHQNPSRYQVGLRSLDRLALWRSEEGTGNLVHETGKFFRIEGLRVETDFPGTPEVWEQPIIHQPEIGVLGILTRVVDGIRYFLMQAKMEPGNVNLVQLSPTVQATRSNFMRAHRGRPTRYLEYFLGGKARILLDQLQSEHGARFMCKRNRNMIVEIDDDVIVDEDFRWMTLAELHALMALDDDLVNMDARSVLSSIRYVDDTMRSTLADATEDEMAQSGVLGADAATFALDLAVSLLAQDRCARSLDQIIAWLTDLKTRFNMRVTPIPLDHTRNWTRREGRIEHGSGDFFMIVGIEVEARNREVDHWCQPILAQVAVGLAGLVSKKINGVLHFLMQGKVEPGLIDTVEIAPTVTVSNPDRGAPHADPPFLALFRNAPAKALRYDRIQSEEGGRFYQTRTRSMILELSPDAEISIPDNYLWMTLGQIHELLRWPGCLNVETRCLIACLGFLPPGTRAPA